MNDPIHHLRVLAFCVALLSTVALLLLLRMRSPAGWDDDGPGDDPDE